MSGYGGGGWLPPEGGWDWAAALRVVRSTIPGAASKAALMTARRCGEGHRPPPSCALPSRSGAFSFWLCSRIVATPAADIHIVFKRMISPSPPTVKRFPSLHSNSIRSVTSSDFLRIGSQVYLRGAKAPRIFRLKAVLWLALSECRLPCPP